MADELGFLAVFEAPGKPHCYAASRCSTTTTGVVSSSGTSSFETSKPRSSLESPVTELLELAQSLAEAAAHLGQPLRAEQEQCDEAEQENLGHSDESGHDVLSVDVVGRPRAGPPRSRAGAASRR